MDVRDLRNERTGETDGAVLKLDCRQVKNAFAVCIVTGLCCDKSGAKDGGEENGQKNLLPTTGPKEETVSSTNNVDLQQMGLSCDPRMTFVLSACNERHYEEALNMIQSLMMFSSCSFTLHFFALPEMKADAETQLRSVMNVFWFSAVKKQLFMYDVKYPEGVDHTDWSGPSKATTCASIRLFLPDLLPQTDSVIYVDSDTLFTEAAENLWLLFSNMKSSQIIAVSPDFETDTDSWYRPDNPQVQTAYVLPRGVNTGVMLMNLTRMRDAKWGAEIRDLEKTYKSQLFRLEQDLINLYFSCHPDRLMLLPCRWNFRPSHCQDNRCTCADAEVQGIALLRGGSSHADYRNSTKIHSHTIYSAFFNFDAGEQSFLDGFLEGLRDTVLGADQPDAPHCAYIYRRLVKDIEGQIISRFPLSFEV
ncbi:putative Glucoside xylosyltransferase 1 [Hypsibius exemplaris]|uniref:UDP-D-xylose:beta-D-glucoside alpha-1,3-D-xylosyltransferase n=1 Tax=Hypsibius exemplaris TaxID=2072580 RepID=A0A1W0WV46_HYPEX|nr:putative Glucoside xylosyltransferase 1 [Hypsibius exemplaris]